MRIFIALVIGVIIAGGPAVWYYSKKKVRAEVLAEQTVSVPTPTPEETPTPTPEPTQVPTPTPEPTPTPVPTPTVSHQQINELINSFAAEYNVSPDILRYIALCESGFNPSAKNGPYAGLYQFNSTTWANRRKLMGEDTNPNLRFDAREAIQTAAYVLHINNAGIWPNCIP